VDPESTSRQPAITLSDVFRTGRAFVFIVAIFGGLFPALGGWVFRQGQDRHYTPIQSAGNDLVALVNDILDLSKIEAGQLQVRPETLAYRTRLGTRC
jgi:signal transduction histidine kinase